MNLQEANSSSPTGKNIFLITSISFLAIFLISTGENFIESLDSLGLESIWWLMGIYAS